MIEKVERLIAEINRIHHLYSKDYFETGKVEKVNLSHTLLRYRPNTSYPIASICMSQSMITCTVPM